MAVAIPLIVAGISAGAAAQQVRAQRRTGDQARRAQERAAQRQSTLLAEAEEEEGRTRRRDLQRQQQRQRAIQARGLRETILTGPLGVPQGQQVQTSGKTLLGT